MCTRFCPALHEPVSPFLWKFHNQVPLASKVKFLGASSQSVAGPRILATVRELGVIVFQLGPSAQGLYGGARGSLLHEHLCHAPQLPGLQQPEPLCPQQAAAALCLRRGHSDITGTSGSVSSGVSTPFRGSWCTRFYLHPPSVSGGNEVSFKMQFRSSYNLTGASPLPLDVGYYFLVCSILSSMVIQQLVAILVFSLKKVSTHPSALPS